MPPFLTASLVESLKSKSKILVKEAQDGEIVQPGVVYIATGGFHMTVKKETKDSKVFIRLSQEPPVNSVRPSADVLFHSLPAAYGPRILSVIMTGMGNDGTEGVRAMKATGCYCISQTADSCIVYGMPRSVDMALLSDEKVPLKGLAQRIIQIVSGKG